MVGPLSLSAVPRIHLELNVRLVKVSRLPKLLAHWKPENWNPSY
jgi:hypothetical protein